MEVQNWAASNFQNRKTDARFESYEYQEFHPINSLTNCTKIDFFLPRYTGPMMYYPSDMQLKVDTVLSQADGQPVENGKIVGPSNLVLHSLFSEVRIYLEDYLLNEANENYSYKAYLTALLTLDSNAKYSWLQAAGFFHDTAKAVDDLDSNNGFDSRRSLFMTDAATYSPAPVTFVGKLFHELASTETGIIPGISIRVELTLQNQDFLIMTDTNTKYKLSIVNAVLFCPVGQLRSDAFRHLQRHLAENPAKIYYQKVQVTNKAIPTNSQTFVTESLFTSSQLPSRVLFGLLPTKTFLGNPRKSPFNFQRKWTWVVEEITQLDSSWAVLPGTSTSRQGSQDTPPPPSPVRQQTTRTCYVEKVTLTLNGKPVDGYDGRASSNDDTLMFMRLSNVLGFSKTRTGNNLTRTDFHNGSYFCAYDLSTSGNSGMNFLVPSVRLGNLRLNLEFSCPTGEEMTLLIYAEFPSLVTIDKYRQIRMTYA